MKQFSLFAVLVLSLGFGLVSCSSNKPLQPEDMSEVEVSTSADLVAQEATEVSVVGSSVN